MKGTLCPKACTLYTTGVFIRGGGSRTPDILFLLGNPSETEATMGAFTSKANQILATTVKKIKQTRPISTHPLIYRANVVSCGCSTASVKKEHIDWCSANLHWQLKRLKPKLIVGLGPIAYKALGFKTALKHSRGHFQKAIIDGVEYNTISTFAPSRMIVSPGLTNLFINDIEKGFDFINNSLVKSPFILEYTKTYEDTIDALDRAIKVFDDYAVANESGTKILSTDMESTSLNAYDPEQRQIAISFGWREGESFKGLAIPWKHRSCVFTDEEFASIKEKTSDLLNHKSVGLVLHNAKFDEKWICHKEGVPMNNIVWDTMLQEHALDEDKKGEYGLKVLTSDYFPSLAGYDKKLDVLLTNLRKERAARNKDIKKLFLKNFGEAVVPYWVSLSEDDRISEMASWLDEGILKEDAPIIRLEYRKTGNPPLLLKKSFTAVAKVLSQIPREKFPEALNLPRIEDALPTEVTFEDIPIDDLLEYAAMDAIVTYKVMVEQSKKQKEERLKEIRVPTKTKLIQSLGYSRSKITLPLSHVIADMEYQGVRIDRDKVQRYQEYLSEKVRAARDAMFMEVGYEFNPNASADLIKILYTDMEYPIVKESEKTGDPSVDAEVLRTLNEHRESPFLAHLLYYRRLEKCKTTYLQSWLDKSAIDGKLHASFNINGTATYRLSSSSPNLQNVQFFVKGVDDPDGTTDSQGRVLPLNLKSVFIPDNDSYELLDADIANAEMRVLCAYSRDATLTKAFNEGMDMHSLTAEGLSDFTYDEINLNKEDKMSPHYLARSVAKIVIFGIIYGMSKMGLSRDLWKKMRIEKTEDEAQEYIDGFFNKYPGVGVYMQETLNFIKKYHWTYTYTGHRRRFPILRLNKKGINRIGRQGVNGRIQTTSADLVNMNLIDIKKHVLEKIGGRMLLTVHDSALMQIPKGGSTSEIKALMDYAVVEKTRENAPWLPVPWKYDAGIGPNYGSCSNFL